MYCAWKVGGQIFPTEKARVHLSGDATLKTGLITNLCEKAPDIVKKEFATLERNKRLEKNQRVQSAKRAAELMLISPEALKKRKKQKQLPFKPFALANKNVDDAWALAFVGLDIAPHKIDNPLFRDAIAATMQAKSGYCICMLLFELLLLLLLFVIAFACYCYCFYLYTIAFV